MGDITFNCLSCQGRVAVDERGCGQRVPCPHCGHVITIPQKPAWLPRINAELRGLLNGRLSLPERRMELKKIIASTGYHPGTAGIEPDSPEDISNPERIDLILNLNADLINGFRQYVQQMDSVSALLYPALELERLARQEEPHDWPNRWKAAGGKIYGGRMIALMDDPIWLKISDFGLPYPPFACNSGMWTFEIEADKAEELGLKLRQQNLNIRFDFSKPAFIPIEDERVTKYFRWKAETAKAECEHCNNEFLVSTLTVCEACGEYICAACLQKGCSGPEPEPPPRDAIECFRRADSAIAGHTLPYEKDVAEQVIQLCGQAFLYGFTANHIEIEAQAHRRMGEALESLGNQAQALEHYERAGTLDPKCGVKKKAAELRILLSNPR